MFHDVNMQHWNFVLKDNSTEISFSYKGMLYDVESSLKGEYNVYNLMAGISSLICLGFDRYANN